MRCRDDSDYTLCKRILENAADKQVNFSIPNDATHYLCRYFFLLITRINSARVAIGYQ